MGENKNLWVGIGNISQNIRFGVTGNGADACSFQMAIGSRGYRTTWVRVNVFDPSVIQYVKDRLSNGYLVKVEGELMNRTQHKNGLQLTEVRAFNISLLSTECECKDHCVDCSCDA